MNEDKSTRYHRYRRWAELLALALQAAPLIVCVGLGLSPWAVGRAGEAVRVLGLPEIALSVTAVLALLFVVVADVLAMPASWYGRFSLERRYRSSRVTMGGWLAEYAAAMLMHGAVVAIVTVTVHLSIDRWPARWWLMCGGIFAMVTLALTHIGPVVVLPAVSRVRPLTRTSLRNRLDALARRVGVQVLGLYQWTPGVGQPHPNAALAGLGRTRRVLITDALLADFGDDEIEVVVAHEFAHYLRRDIWTTLVSDGLMATAVCGSAHAVVDRLRPTLGIASIADPSALPALALVAGLTVAALAPVRNLILRWQERRADRDAVRMTGNAQALISGLRRLAAQSLAEERPPRVARWLLSTHPPFTDRVSAAALLARGERR